MIVLFFDALAFAGFPGEGILFGQSELDMLIGYLAEEGVHRAYQLVHLGSSTRTNTFVAVAGIVILPIKYISSDSLRLDLL